MALNIRPANAGADWSRMQLAATLQGPSAVIAVVELRKEMTQWHALPELERVQAVNTFFNERTRFETDLVATGLVDSWASPVETMARGRGDCEDYAIAKFFTLIAAGVAPAKLRMVYVRAELYGLAQAHMVAIYRPTPEADPMVLDNLIVGLLPASQRTDLKPVFSFGLTGLWEGTSSSEIHRGPLSKWLEVTLKARSEGFIDPRN